MLGRQEPQAKALVLVRPTKSRVLFAQMVGRGTRRHPGKQDCLVLDLIGAGERHARSFAWACGYGRHAGLYALPAGDRARVALQQVADRWRVWHTEGREQRLVTDGLDLEYAQGVAEDLVRRMGAVVLARRGSEWRSLAASENQLRALTEMGVEVLGEITRGEASDLLSLEATRRDLLPPTSRQLWALRQRGLDPSAALTKRHAMALLDGRVDRPAGGLR